LKAEPLREYEERKKKAPEAAPGGRRPGAGGPPVEVSSNTPAPAATPAGIAAKPEAGMPAMPADMPPAEGGAAAAAAAPAPDAGMGMGMMFGMGGRRGGPPGPPPVKYEPTAWGRYAKILLSSSEFLFIN
jgi:hypothetical protein